MNLIMKNLWNSEPVRLRGYTILGVILAYVTAKGYIDAETKDVVLTVVGLAAGIGGVEELRSRVYAPATVAEIKGAA